MRNRAFWTSLPGILTGIAAVIGASVGLVTAFGPESDASQPAATVPASTTEAFRAAAPVASITEPLHGEAVCHEQTVRGTVSRLPESARLWLVLYAPDIERWYPISRPQPIVRDGASHWSSVAHIGRDARDEGDGYELQVHSADAKASRVFTADARRAAQGRGMTTLPAGAQQLDEIFVRKDAC